MISKVILILFPILVIVILFGSKLLSIQDVVQEFLGISSGQDDGWPGGGVVGCHPCKDDCRCDYQQLLSGGDGLVFFHNCHFNLSLCLLQLLRRLSDNYRKCQGVRLCCDWLSQSLTPVSKKPVFRKTEPPL